MPGRTVPVATAGKLPSVGSTGDTAGNDVSTVACDGGTVGPVPPPPRATDNPAAAMTTTPISPTAIIERPAGVAHLDVPDERDLRRRPEGWVMW